MAKCGWCGRYFESGYKCGEGVVVGNYRYHSFCSQKCFFEAKNREGIEAEQKAAIAEAVQEGKRKNRLTLAYKLEKDKALNEKSWKDAEEREREAEKRRSPEELKLLEEKAKSYGYESYSAMQKTISNVKQILEKYNNHAYESEEKRGWLPPKENLKEVKELFKDAFPIDRCLAIVRGDNLHGIAFTDSALYIQQYDESQISYADIEDVDEEVDGEDFDTERIYIIKAKNGKKIKVQVSTKVEEFSLNFYSTPLDEISFGSNPDERRENDTINKMCYADERFNLGKLLQELAKEGKKNPNVERVPIIANKTPLTVKIFCIVVLALIAFVVYKCTH